jgi:hypothetical protein
MGKSMSGLGGERGMKKLLSEAFPSLELMTPWECIDSLGWIAVNSTGSDNTGPVTCSCGSAVKFGGWFGTEHAWCPDCGKGMQDMTGLLPASQSTVSMVDVDKYEIPSDGKYWTPVNIWGYGIKKEINP